MTTVTHFTPPFAWLSSHYLGLTLDVTPLVTPHPPPHPDTSVLFSVLQLLIFFSALSSLQLYLSIACLPVST